MENKPEKGATTINDYDDWGGYDGGPDVTGDPALDVQGYQSPRDPNPMRLRPNRIEELADLLDRRSQEDQ